MILSEAPDSAGPPAKLWSVSYTSEFDLPQGKDAGLFFPQAGNHVYGMLQMRNYSLPTKEAALVLNTIPRKDAVTVC